LVTVEGEEGTEVWGARRPARETGPRVSAAEVGGGRAWAVRPRTAKNGARPTAAEPLARRLLDQRRGQVVVLSHCLLNENTRYLGGAGRPGCVREIVDGCTAAGLGMIQMPCPEEAAWGGVHKRRLLLLYGSARWLPGPLRRLLLPALLDHTHRIYGRLARDTGRRAADYRRAGLDVVAVVGVDGSPSCGVARTLDIPAAVDRLARADRRTLTTAAVNAIVRDTVVPGSGLFTELLRRDLGRRGIDLPYLAHDLLGELDGAPSPVVEQLRAATVTRPGSARTGRLRTFRR